MSATNQDRFGRTAYESVGPPTPYDGLRMLADRASHANGLIVIASSETAGLSPWQTMLQQLYCQTREAQQEDQFEYPLLWFRPPSSATCSSVMSSGSTSWAFGPCTR